MKLEHEFESVEITTEERMILLQLLYLEAKRIEALPNSAPEELAKHTALLRKLLHAEEVITHKTSLK